MKRTYIVGAVLVTLLAAAALYLYGGGQAPAGQLPLQKISPQSVGEIKNEFNVAKDGVRVLLLIGTFGSASAGLRIWEPVLFTDWSAPSTATLGRISNTRTAQFWDKDWLISHSMGEHDRRSIVWDYIAVYPPGAVWEAHPQEPLYRGGPVIRVMDEARSALSKALSREQAQYVGAK